MNDFIYANDLSTIILAEYVGWKKYPNFAAFFPVLIRKIQWRYPTQH
jgi:hypothetical protein